MTKVSLTPLLKIILKNKHRLSFVQWNKTSLNWTLIKSLLNNDTKLIKELLKREPEWLEFI